MYTNVKIIACTGGCLFNMAHVAKYTKAACGHMFAHYERAKGIDGEYINFGNENIDTNKSDQNYNLAPDHGMNQGSFVKKRCSEVQCLNRKDVNVMCSWVVTIPKGFPKEHEREFFEQTYKFLENRYGQKNVVSAYVHMDEVQPHLHFAFVPVIYDKKKGLEKVSAKEKVSKTDLQTFHGDLEKALESHFNRSVGILNEATKEGNKSIIELKRGTAQDKLQAILQEQQEALDAIKVLKEKMNGLEQAKELYKEDLKSLQKVFDNAKIVQTTYNQIDSIEGKIGAFNKDKVTLHVSDFEKLKELAKKSATLEYELNNIQGELKRL